MMQPTLMLIDVAYLGKNENDSLVFVNGDKHGIWPSMYDACKAIFIIRFVVHAFADYTPYDGTPRIKIVTIALPLTIVLTFLNVCGIISAVICLIFNIFYRKKRSYSIKLIYHIQVHSK